MGNLYLSEVFINRDQHARLGENEPYEAWTEDPGKLFRSLQREYGRCVSKVYIDQKDGSTKAVGWVFVGRQKYTDVDETYLREVWVTLHEAPPTVVRTLHYREIPT